VTGKSCPVSGECECRLNACLFAGRLLPEVSPHWDDDHVLSLLANVSNIKCCHVFPQSYKSFSRAGDRVADLKGSDPLYEKQYNSYILHIQWLSCLVLLANISCFFQAHTSS
jgi:hypothetical protein